MAERTATETVGQGDLHTLAPDASGYPHVVPVNCGLDGRTVIFRTGLGLKLDRISRGTPMAFQVDDVDPAWQEGWSVLLQGVGREIVASHELVRVAGLVPKPWASGNRARYIRIQPDRVSGRRIA